LFRRFNVGQERIGDNIGSDLFLMTFAQTLAVTAGMAAAPSSGLGKAKHFVRLFRGVTLVFYLIVRNVALGSRAGAAISATAIAAGATIVLLVALAGVSNMPDALLAAGWILFLGAFLSALVRSFYATVVITIAGLIAYATRETWLNWFEPFARIRSLGPLVVILLVVVVLYVLGSVRLPRWRKKFTGLPFSRAKPRH
jgi:hypothetical protein